MQTVTPLVLALAVVACSATPEGLFDSRYAAPVEDGALVRVVDARGEPVPGAEVRAGAILQDPSEHWDLVLKGQIGAIESYGRVWQCDSRGEVRVARDLLTDPIVARHDALWGATWVASDDLARNAPITIAVETDESIRAVCADAEGRPGLGAHVWVSAKPPADPTGRDQRWLHGFVWGGRVERADGTLAVPHAQYWRALAKQGFDVKVAGFTMWDEALHQNRFERVPEPGADLHFVVGSSGAVDFVVRMSDGATVDARGTVTLRWLDAPPEPDAEPGEVDIPDFPCSFRGGAGVMPGVLVGHEFELVVDDLPGWIDPRTKFDGPQSHGDRVRVELVARTRAARLQGRFVDEAGAPLAYHQYEAWVEAGGKRFELDEDATYTDVDGRFACDVAPVESKSGAVFVVRIAEPMPDGARPVGETFVLGTGAMTRAAEPTSARRALSSPLRAGAHDLGDVRCAMPRAAR